ncbi:MAG: hypothetical protein EBU26_18215 [Verrucomicrobia bacterium]|nr:hypothetical protein [Verrucomicrobiota bacterium]
MEQQAVVSLGSLEASLGLSRVDLLLVIRELGIQPVRKGMRTWIKKEETGLIYQHLGKTDCLEPLEAEVVNVEPSAPYNELMVTNQQNNRDVDEEFKKYSKLRLLRERIEVLDLLRSTGIEMTSHEICSLLELKRLPPLQTLDDGVVGFRRMGLEFEKVLRPGHRLSWKARNIEKA